MEDNEGSDRLLYAENGPLEETSLGQRNFYPPYHFCSKTGTAHYIYWFGTNYSTREEPVDDLGGNETKLTTG